MYIPTERESDPFTLTEEESHTCNPSLPIFQTLNDELHLEFFSSSAELHVVFKASNDKGAFWILDKCCEVGEGAYVLPLSKTWPWLGNPR